MLSGGAVDFDSASFRMSFEGSPALCSCNIACEFQGQASGFEMKATHVLRLHWTNPPNRTDWSVRQSTLTIDMQ
jgi:hypothetical protein